MKKKRPGRLNQYADAAEPGGRRVIVKFADGIQDLVDGPEIERRLAAYLGHPWAALRARHPEVQISRVFNPRTVRPLERLAQRARSRDSGYKVPNFGNYFAITCPQGTDARDLARQLSGLGGNIDTAYVFLPAVDSDDVFPTAAELADQPHLGVGPDGVNAIFAWSQPGGDGAGEHFADVERGWQLTHEALPTHNTQPLYGHIRNASRGHGTSAVGIVCANPRQVTAAKRYSGIAPGLRDVVVASYYCDFANAAGNPCLDARDDPSYQSKNPDIVLRPTAITLAAQALVERGTGGVLLIEAQLSDKDTGNLWPIETQDLDYKVIEAATAAGVVVIEPAGNGHQDLDSFHDASGNYVLNRSGQLTRQRKGGKPEISAAAGFRDSGAIMVTAAAVAVKDGLRIWQPPDNANIGSRIDCFACGDGIYTSGTTVSPSGVTVNRATDWFRKTSAAAAVIAGVAVVTQGLNFQRHGQRLDSRQMRSILSGAATGTASENGSAVDKSGVMPDLQKIVQLL